VTHAGGRSFFFSTTMHVLGAHSYLNYVPSVAGWLQSRASLWGDGWIDVDAPLALAFHPRIILTRDAFTQMLVQHHKYWVATLTHSLCAMHFCK
jgi:hypothetical protein